MTTYTIDFTDPLQGSFQILPGAYNGPGSATPQSSLRLYGRGALEWGESVDEDLIKQLQSFASATPAQLRLSYANDVDNSAPVLPLQGQLWFRGKLYHLNNDATPIWYQWNFDTESWDVITTSVNDVTTFAPYTTASGGLSDPLVVNPALQVIGNYIYDTNTETLYRWDQFYRQFAATWLERTHTVSATAPTGPPAWDLLVWNGTNWVPPKSTTVSNTAPSDPSIGDFWLDTSTYPPILYIWDGLVWRPFLYSDGSIPMTGDLDMGGFRIVNMDDPISGAGAVTVDYADANYVLLDGSNSPMTGYLELFADPVSDPQAATKKYVDDQIAGATGTFDSIYIRLDGTNTPTTGFITLNAEPTSALHASTKSYADKGLRPDSATVGTPTAPKYFFSTSAPTGGDGSNGDIWFQYV